MTYPDRIRGEVAHEDLSSVLSDALLKTWREGVQDGFRMAHRMIEAVQAECVRRAGNVEAGSMIAVNIDVLDGLMAGLTDSVDYVETLERP